MTDIGNDEFEAVERAAAGGEKEFEKYRGSDAQKWDRLCDCIESELARLDRITNGDPKELEHVVGVIKREVDTLEERAYKTFVPSASVAGKAARHENGRSQRGLGR